MNELLMFNPVDSAYFFISASNTQDIERMQGNGFVKNPKLVAMYRPDDKKHIMVMVQDTKKYESQGYFAEPTMIYHPKEPTQMVSAVDAKKACNNGWYLSPAQFPQNNRSDGVLKLGANKEAS